MSFETTKETKTMKRLATMLTAFVLAALALAPAAIAAYGDGYGAAPINNPPTTQAVPALPGATHAFWAGACDLAAAPAFGVPVAGGIGSRPATILAPTGELPVYPGIDVGIFTTAQGPASAAAAADHCLDLGAPTLTGAQIAPDEIWQSIPWGSTTTGETGQPNPVGDYAPSWRLPAATQAGGHPDGTTMLAWDRSTDGIGIEPGHVDGSPDNVRVDLPPGFVANPQALPTCSAEQFSAFPLECPPQTQVGILRLNMEAVSKQVGANLGVLNYDTAYPVYNLEPRPGRAAELGLSYVSGLDAVTVRLSGDVRTSGDFGVTAFAGQIPAALLPVAQSITIWGVPWASSHDPWRPLLGHRPSSLPCNSSPGTNPQNRQYLPPGSLPGSDCQAHYDPSWGPIRPFVSNETDCDPSPTVRLVTDAFQHPGAFTADGEPDTAAYPYPFPAQADESANWKLYTSTPAAVTGCEKLGFDPSASLDPVDSGGGAVTAADSPAGLAVELRIPQNNEPPAGVATDPGQPSNPDGSPGDLSDGAPGYWRTEAGLATSHLRDTVVTLPEGMTLNPAAANGQAACTMGQIGVAETASATPPAIRFHNSPVACPDASKVGTVVVETPLLEAADWPVGNVYLATQGSNPFGSDFAIYIAVESEQRGVLAKLAGKVTPDPVTGQLTTSFVDNPELPFERFRLRFKGGPTAPLATPVTCGSHVTSSQLSSYSRPSEPVALGDPFSLTSSPAGGCPATKAARPLSLGFTAGTTGSAAGKYSPFTLRLTRPDGNQELDRVEVTTPEGFAAKLKGVETCSDAAIDRARARTASGDGAKEQAAPSCPAASQVGTTTIGAGAGSKPYYVTGKAYLAGPYKGAPASLAFIVPAVAGPFDLGVQVVRAALNVNPRTAQITTVSDQIPQILRGIPLRIRDIRVDIDRAGFTINPTDCSEMAVTSKVFGASGAVASVGNRFQADGCANLGFKPSLKLELFGGTKRTAYQRLKATLTAREGDANIARASVALPHSEFLAQNHIRTICTRVQFAADSCPAASIYGKATAVSPLLDQPLTGPVYLRSSDNPLPDLVAALRGPDQQPIEIELAGRTDSVHGGIRNTFDIVPDAPVSKFTLEMFGGKKSLIQNSRDICDGVQRATAKFDAQNGRSYSFRPKVVNQRCGKKKAKVRRVAVERSLLAAWSPF